MTDPAQQVLTLAELAELTRQRNLLTRALFEAQWVQASRSPASGENRDGTWEIDGRPTD